MQNYNPQKNHNLQKGLAIVGCCAAFFVYFALWGVLGFGSALAGIRITWSQSMVFTYPLCFSIFMLPGVWLAHKFPVVGKALMVVSIIGSTAYIIPTFLFIRSLLHTRSLQAGDGGRLSAKKTLAMLFIPYFILTVLWGLLEKFLPSIHLNPLTGRYLTELGFVGSWGIVIVLILVVYSILKGEIRFK